MSKAARLAGALGLLLTVSMAWAQAPDLQNMDLVLRSVPDGPIAKINGRNVPKEEYIDLYRLELIGVMKELGTTKVTDRVRVQTGIHSARTLVQHEVLYQEAVKRKLDVSDKEVEDSWKDTLQKLHENAEQGGDKKISDEEILKKAGKTREEAIAGLRKAMLVRKMRDQILADNKISVSDADVKDFYEKNKDGFKQPERLHLEQIFIGSRKGPRDPVDSTKKEQARHKIEQALKRVQAGENFQAVAKAVSEVPDKDNGGDMGMIPTSKLPPFYVKAAASMRPGDISGIIESEYGFHFIKLVESAVASDVEPEKATPFVRSLLGSQRGDKAVQEFCKPILENPDKVEIYLQLEKTLSNYPGFEDLLTNKNQPENKAQGANAGVPADNSPAKTPASVTKPKKSSKK